MLRKALGKCKSEAERSESAIAVLKNALDLCKSEGDKSESAGGVLKNALGQSRVKRARAKVQ